MSTITVCAASVIASVLAIILRKNNTEYSIILTVLTCVILITYILGAVTEAVNGVKDLFSQTNLNTSYLTVILKSVGICFLTEFCSDTCKDAGQAALSNIVLYSGRILVILTSLPLFSELLLLVTELTGG